MFLVFVSIVITLSCSLFNHFTLTPTLARTHSVTHARAQALDARPTDLPNRLLAKIPPVVAFTESEPVRWEALDLSCLIRCSVGRRGLDDGQEKGRSAVPLEVAYNHADRGFFIVFILPCLLLCFHEVWRMI